MYSYGIDPTYILVLIGLAITLGAQAYMTSIFNKYQVISSKSGMTASEVAKLILDNNGITEVKVGHVTGNLTDHYAPTKKELNLSDVVYNNTSIAAIGVAAHETGHAVQDHKMMALLRFQMFMVPTVNLCSQLALPLIAVGFILGQFNLTMAGILLFAVTLGYQLVTLPIEFNASHNAIKTLREYNIMDETELAGVKKVLTAAALTYVAAAASTILQLLRFFIIAKNNSRKN